MRAAVRRLLGALSRDGDQWNTLREPLQVVSNHSHANRICGMLVCAVLTLILGSGWKATEQFVSKEYGVDLESGIVCRACLQTILHEGVCLFLPSTPFLIFSHFRHAGPPAREETTVLALASLAKELSNLSNNLESALLQFAIRETGVSGRIYRNKVQSFPILIDLLVLPLDPVFQRFDALAQTLAKPLIPPASDKERGSECQNKEENEGNRSGHKGRPFALNI